MGGGSVIKSLREQFAFRGIVTAVEIDQFVIALAAEEFNVTADNDLKIVHEDAFDFVESCKEEFNLVIIDLFIDNRVPVKFYSIEFWNHIIQLVSKNGFLIFNCAVLETDLEWVNEICKILQGKFRLSVFEHVEGSNTLITAEKIQL